MTPEQRRAQLRRLLNALPMERDAYLHDGRAMTRPPVDDLVDKIEALFADEMPSMLDRLWKSSTGLLKRFDARPSVKQAVERMMSEIVELIVAAHDTDDAVFEAEDIAKEAADVWVTVINVLNATGVSQEQLETAIEAVMDSNDKKDHTSYRRSQQHGVERLIKESQS
jgi:NTP pyrophosphatase (non-canonical NTP hydrolase)